MLESADSAGRHIRHKSNTLTTALESAHPGGLTRTQLVTHVANLLAGPLPPHPSTPNPIKSISETGASTDAHSALLNCCRAFLRGLGQTTPREQIQALDPQVG